MHSALLRDQMIGNEAIQFTSRGQWPPFFYLCFFLPS
jgi:hypothetical protein